MISSLNLCKEHKQEWKQSEYASHNCDYCKATWEINKLQHQLEIQTKRVENLKNFLSQGDELKVLREWIFRSDSLSRCQAIDQELEKQLEEKC